MILNQENSPVGLPQGVGFLSVNDQEPQRSETWQEESPIDPRQGLSLPGESLDLHPVHAMISAVQNPDLEFLPADPQDGQFHEGLIGEALNPDGLVFQPLVDLLPRGIRGGAAVVPGPQKKEE
ncbi:MAG: hypothetical protein HGA50_05680 [Deltaproteobacteria bacterium]|nr:hypothetical protein [Deltaproteobacteria bacterium]